MVPCGGFYSHASVAALLRLREEPPLLKMEITTYERCETMAEGLPEDHLVGLTKPSVDRILKMDAPGDCLALYTFYCYTRKWQKNSSIYATSDFAMTALGWGRDRFSNAKKQLKEQGFIDDIARRNDAGKVEKWYVGVRYAQTATLANFHTTENPHCGESAPKYLGMVKEIQMNGKEILSKASESSPMGSHSSDWWSQLRSDLNRNKEVNADAIDSRPPNSGQKHNKARNEIPPPKKPRAAKLADEAFIAQLREANPRVDFDAEMKKMDNWLLANPTRKKTRQFVCNWINRVVERLAPEEDWKPTTI